MGGEAVAQRVATPTLLNTRPLYSVLYRLLQNRFRYVMPADDTCTWIKRALGSRENVLPHPGFPRLWVLACEGIWQVHFTVPLQQIFLVQHLHFGEMSLQCRLDRLWEHRDPVLRPFPVPHGDLMIGKIDILHPQAHAFHQTQTRPIEQIRHQTRHATELCQDSLYFLACKDRWHTSRTFGALDVLERREG